MKADVGYGVMRREEELSQNARSKPGQKVGGNFLFAALALFDSGRIRMTASQQNQRWDLEGTRKVASVAFDQSSSG
jgi:hypothetical protein